MTTTQDILYSSTNPPLKRSHASLWESWWGNGDKDAPPLETCSLITTDANKLAQEIHDRMPVILDPVDYDAWLNPENSDVSYLLAPFDADRMTARSVSTYVNNARNQGGRNVLSRVRYRSNPTAVNLCAAAATMTDQCPRPLPTRLVNSHTSLPDLKSW